jgi:hypothetical protein
MQPDFHHGLLAAVYTTSRIEQRWIDNEGLTAMSDPKIPSNAVSVTKIG